MYRKAVGLLSLMSIALMMCFLCVRGLDAVRLCGETAQNLRLGLWELEEKWAGKAQEAVDSALIELFASYNTYRWAVDYGILN